MMSSMLYRRVQGGFIERVPDGYIDGMAEMLGIKHCKAPVTPGVKIKKLLDGDEKLLDATRHSTYRSIVGKAQWILRVRVDLLYAVKELSRRLSAPREVDLIAAKRLVKYLWHTRGLCMTIVPTF